MWYFASVSTKLSLHRHRHHISILLLNVSILQYVWTYTIPWKCENDLKYGINTWCSDTLYYGGSRRCISQILPSIMRVYISSNIRTAFGSTSSMLVYGKKYRTIMAIWLSVKWSLMQVPIHGHSSSLIQVTNLFYDLRNVYLSLGLYWNSTIKTYLLINMSILRHSGLFH